jgi:hypothetical protein
MSAAAARGTLGDTRELRGFFAALNTLKLA